MDIRYFKTLPSTNRAAAEAARAGCAAFTVIAAETQSAGRGRLSRSFFSPRGGSYFSIVLRPSFPAAEYGRLTPFAAVALWRAVRRTTGLDGEIKWVNDLLLGGKKIAGILAESGVDDHGAPFVVIGIGVNTGNAPFPPELAGIAAHLDGVTSDALIPAAAAEFLNFEREIADGTWLDLYRRHCPLFGKTVTVSAPHAHAYTAVALDILPNGALSVKRENGALETLTVGEISLRTAQNN